MLFHPDILELLLASQRILDPVFSNDDVKNQTPIIIAAGGVAILQLDNCFR